MGGAGGDAGPVVRPRDVVALFAFPSRPRADTPGRGVAPNTCGLPERELDIFRSIAAYAHAACNAETAGRRGHGERRRHE